MTTGQRYIEQHRTQILELCRRYPIERLYFFGSVLTDDFDLEKSDVDMQVMFDTTLDGEKRGILKWRFWNDIEDLLGKKVDMLTEQPIRNPFFKNAVDTTKALFYERKSEEVFV
jgi:uncharacterized protein